MTSRPPPATSEPTVYLVAVDGTPSDTHVLEVACGLGAMLGGAAELHIVHVLGGPVLEGGVMTPGIVRTEEVEAEDRLALDRSTAYAAARFGGKIAGHLASGEPWRAIVRLAASLSVDLVVVGTSGLTGLTRMLLGSVAEEVVRHAGCPVLVARPKDHQSNAAPVIEPPCPDCVAVQKRTARATLWCERHSEHHPHGELHYELPPTFAVGSMNLRP